MAVTPIEARPRSGDRRRWWLPLVGVTCLACVDDSAPPAPPELRDLRWFLRRQRDLSSLPELEASATRMESTWDRAGQNADCCDYQRVSGDTNVLLDVDGPGCLHRIFTGAIGFWVEGTRLQVFLDESTAPLLDLPVNEFFSEDGPFPEPLLVLRSYPGSLFPVPFARHIKVQLVNRQPLWGGYWQLTYTRYAPGTPVESLHLPLRDDERAELARVRDAWSAAVAAPAPLPAGLRVTRDAMALAPGASRELRVDGAGVIRELRLTSTPRSGLRDLRLRLWWDGDAEPAVDLRASDLFGLSAYSDDDDNAVFSSLAMGADRDGAWVRLPMPFARGARVSFENGGAATVALGATLSIEARASLPSNWGELRVDWNSAPAAAADSPRVQGVPTHTVLDAVGPGKYVGVMLAVDWQTADWWGEGDWIISTDGEDWPPGYHGTGTEEYFNSGWYRFDRAAVSGFIEFQPRPPAVYSFHLNDAFQFQRHIRVDAETVGDPRAQLFIDYLHPAWSTAAFWYRAR